MIIGTGTTAMEFCSWGDWAQQDWSQSVSQSVVSNSLQPHGLEPARLLCPWNSPGKNTGVGSHSFLQGIFPTQGLNLGLVHYRKSLYHLSHLGSPKIDVISRAVTAILRHVCSVMSDSWVQGVSHQAPLPMEFSRQWGAISYSRGSSQLKDWTCTSCFSCIGRWILYH